MKDSGMVWIGCVPEQWKRYRLRYLCEMKTGGTPEDKYGINDDGEGYPWITAPDINETYRISSYSQYINDKAIKQCNYKLFPPNSTLLVCIASVGKLGLIEEYCYANQQITALIPNQFVEPEFLMYYIQAMSVKIIDDASSNVVPIINSQYLKNICVFIPDLLEQKRITAFINKRVVLTNSILSDLQKQIEILDNYKKSLITEIVTKGLNPNAPMKDSGVEWIGDVSATNEIIKLKYYSYMKGRIGWQGLNSEDFIDEGPYCVTGTDFVNGSINWKSCYHVSEERYNMDPNIQLRVGDLLVTKDGTIGKLAMIKELPEKACLNSHLLIIRPLKDVYINEYLYYVMLSDMFSTYYRLVSTGSTMDSLSQEKMGNFQFPIHSIEEQKNIVDYLDDKCQRIDEIIQNKSVQITKLEDYKQSLIFEYVTGKKRVKEAMEWLSKADS